MNGDEESRSSLAKTPPLHDAEEAKAPRLSEPSRTEDDRDGPLELPARLPILAVRESVAFPGTVVPFSVSREKSKRVLDIALAGNKLIAIVAQRRSETEDPRLSDLYRVGTACRILKLLRMPDGSETIVVHGMVRVGLETLTQESPYPEAVVHASPDHWEPSTELDALVHTVRHAAQRAMELSPNVPDEARVVLENIETPGALADFLAANLSLSLIHKQEILETFGVMERLRKINAALAAQLEVLELSRKMQEQVQGQMEKSQRDYYLREQMKVIQKELGQSEGQNAALDQLRLKVKVAKMPAAVELEAGRELERLAIVPQASPEYSLGITYLEWLAGLPWSVSTTDRIDLRRAKHILDQDHYGLDKVKKRILEFLAVRKLKPDSAGPILCFAGPPGVGKTSLGQSIARALDRKFVRISLGGMRDEAEIRGHRRTYVGALPGRIIRELRKAGANNPVFMLDEVDKIGQDFHGDPASALLEVLDPRQNDTFTDHYLDVPFDLSKVMFIATANYMDPIPAALLDRMEVISLPGYTAGEKLHIARNYLVPRQLEAHGLKTENLDITDEVINTVITGYTREAGVRDLEREIGALCRGRAASIVRGGQRGRKLTFRDVYEALGPVQHESTARDRVNMPGVVTGLAFTPVGGEILFVEATRMPGSGNLQLTGQIGEVMRESAMAAFSIVRSRTQKLHIDPEALKSGDIHIHVPAGAIPKDGPSAGVAMLTALVSLLTHRAVDTGTGMTGEITLRGRVLPIGGVKEKVLAAHRAGLTRVILPAGNKKDLIDIPREARKEIHFVHVDTIDQLLKAVFAERDPVTRKHRVSITRAKNRNRP